MPKRIFTPEQILAKLRQIEVLMGQGKTGRRHSRLSWRISRSTRL